MDYIAENNPLLISGIHRAGTSLLSEILENQDIFIGFFLEKTTIPIRLPLINFDQVHCEEI